MAIFGELPPLIVGAIASHNKAADGLAHSGFAGGVYPANTRAVSITARVAAAQIKVGAADTGSIELGVNDTLVIRLDGSETKTIYVDVGAGGSADIIAWG